MPVRQRSVLTLSLPPDMAKEFRRLASEKDETVSGLFREIFVEYTKRRQRKSLKALQEYGASKGPKGGMTEEAIDRLIFGDR